MEAPQVLVRVCLEEMGVLMAEEAQDDAIRVAMGSGTLKKSRAREVERRWRRQLRRRRRVRREPSDARPDGLPGIAIRVVRTHGESGSSDSREPG